MNSEDDNNINKKNDNNNENDNKVVSSGSDISFASTTDSYDDKNMLKDNDEDEFLFFNDDCEIDDQIDDWKVIIADDDIEVHSMTKIILNNIEYENRNIKMISSYSGEETIALIKKHPDTAILVLDVVMETETAGFDVVKYVRDELKNNRVRIILRTGEPGQAPEKDVIENYDINDYKEKTELTAQKFYTTILTSLRSYKDIIAIENSRISLQKMVSYSATFHKEHEFISLIDKIISSFDEILRDEYGGKCIDYSLLFSKVNDSSEFRLSAVHGNFDELLIGKKFDEILKENIIQKIKAVISNKEKLFDNNLFIGYYTSGENHEDIVFVKTKSTITQEKISLLNLHDLTVSNSLSKFFYTKKQNKTKATLLSSKNYLSSILDSLTSMIFLIDSNFKITLANKAIEKLLNMEMVEILNKNIFVLIPYIEKFRDQIAKVFQSKQPINVSGIERKHIQGNKSFYNATITPIELVEFSGAVLRIDDVTEMKQKDDQLLQSQKMESIGNLAGGLAHDFNNVLGGMVGSASLLKFSLKSKNKVDTDYILSHLEIIENAGKRATDMVRQLLTLSRKQEYKLAPVDLNQSVKHVMKICINSFDKSIKLEANYLKKYATVKADPTQIEQVILNICINASHAMTIMRSENEKPGGTLRIVLSEFTADREFCQLNIAAEEIKYWKLEIEDNGVGMNDDILTKIFDPFYTTKNEKEGSGLGLSMVYKIIKGHNGIILVNSTPSIGTKFSIYLPLLEKQVDFETSKTEKLIAKKSGTILILDDEELIIEAEKEMLESVGYKVVSFLKSSEAIKTYETMYNDISAVILDMNMPEMSGREVFKNLKNINPNVKALLTSGYRLDSSLPEILDEGFKGFIEKPFTFIRFLEAVDEIINED